MKNISNKKNSIGFTLIELVVVVAIMGLMSTMAMDLYTDKSNQKRFELTKQRLAEIKFAIIGDPMMRVGSQVVLTGFFNDMKRLPRNIDELISANGDPYCLHDTKYSIDTSKTISDCPSGWTWTDDSIRLKTWNGPYLINIQSDGNALIFSDAWGNSSSDGNFGWKVTTEDTTKNLIIESLGLDRVEGGSTGNEYELDYSRTIFISELERIDNITQDAGYCIDISGASYEIDQNFNKNECIAQAATHKWSTFKQAKK